VAEADNEIQFDHTVRSALKRKASIKTVRNIE